MNRLIALVLLFTLGGALPSTALWAQGAGADPSINRPYQDPDFEQWMQRFERPGREVYDQRHQIVEASGVQPGMAVADVGAGTGLFTLLFAERVGPDGRVYAVDISRPFIEGITARAEAQGLRNVVGVVSSQTDTGLTEASVDLVFLSDTYHHFEQPQQMLASFHRALRPGGQLVVIDFHRIPGRSSPWVLGHVRLGRDEAVAEIEAAGFRLAAEEDFLSQNYFVRFVRTE